MLLAVPAGKIISYYAQCFPRSASIRSGLIRVERPNKLQTHKVIVIEVIDPHGLSSDGSGEFGQCALRTNGRAWDFQGNGRRSGERTAYHHQSSTRGDIDSGGKFQRILPVSVTSPDKNRNGQLQPRPFPCFLAHILARHATSRLNQGKNCLFRRTLRAKVEPTGFPPPQVSEPRYQRGI
jgi:hypothetical protein